MVNVTLLRQCDAMPLQMSSLSLTFLLSLWWNHLCPWSDIDFPHPAALYNDACLQTLGQSFHPPGCLHLFGTGQNYSRLFTFKHECVCIHVYKCSIKSWRPQDGLVTYAFWAPPSLLLCKVQSCPLQKHQWLEQYMLQEQRAITQLSRVILK